MIRKTTVKAGFAPTNRLGGGGIFCRLLNARRIISALALSATLAASADITGLTDLTDDNDNRANVSGNDKINALETKGTGAFNIQEEATQDKINNDGDSNRLGLQITDSNPLWVTYEFKEATVVNAYRIWNNTGDWAKSERAPKDFYLEGSSDGETWTTLDSRSDQTDWSVGEPRVFEFINKTAYNFYRMTFTAHNGDTGGWLMIQELEYFCRQLSDDSLIVTGSPETYGSPTPAYGASEAKEGDEVSAFVDTLVEISSDRQVAVCTGWKTEKLGDGDSWEDLSNGEGNSVSFTHPGGDVRLTWIFEVSNRVETVVHGDEGCGTVTDGGWFVQGGSATLKATANAGYDFIRWMGDTDGVEDPTAAEITVTADSPRTLTAFFVQTGMAKVMYVSPEGDDDNDGFSETAAKKTIAAAVKSLDEMFMEGKVIVAPGVYEQRNAFVLSNAIEVVGRTGRPEDVILRNLVRTDNQNVVTLRNEQALVSGVAIENGTGYYSRSYGGNVLIEGDGGTVSNCVIRSGSGEGVYGGNVCINSANALVTHCVISNAAVYTVNDAKGIAIYVSTKGGGRISNCLITQNATADNAYQKVSNKQLELITLAGPAVMDNCTIVDNCHTGLSVVVHATAADARIYNCVIAKNTTTEGTAASISWNANKGKFVNCVTDGDEVLNETCKVGALADMFESVTDGKWLPKADGILKNEGTTEGLAVPSIDLKGNPRIRGNAIDVGCYEIASRSFTIRIR